MDWIYWQILKKEAITTIDCASNVTDHTRWTESDVVTLTSGSCHTHEAYPRPFLTNCTYNYDYTGRMETLTIPTRGKYIVKVWGGGSNGRGGYSQGTAVFSEASSISVCVGGAGFSGGNYSAGPSYPLAGGGFNGGGNGQMGGGGATHIALGSRGILSNYVNNKDEVIIVAGGGGGSDGNGLVSGVGGGLTGTDGIIVDAYSHLGNAGKGTQVSGGKGVTVPATGITFNGEFGKGGDVPSALYGKSSYDSAGAGGGGWFGGGGAPAGWCSCGAGGSGYIQTESTCSHFNYTPKIALIDASTLDGSNTITDPDGSTSTGHAGNGYARIVFLSY